MDTFTNDAREAGVGVNYPIDQSGESGAHQPAADRAATPSEPSQSSVVSGKAGIPCAFTPGPWLMAAAPSFIVGWPIVAPQGLGRVVAKLCYADPKAFGGKGPGDGAYNLESEANGRLIAAAPELYEALELYLNHGAMMARDKAEATLAKARGQ